MNIKNSLKYRRKYTCLLQNLTVVSRDDFHGIIYVGQTNRFEYKQTRKLIR